MTYNWVIFNKENMEKVGEVITNHSVSLDDAIDLLGAVRLETVNSDDPDFLIDGKEFWYDDLDMVLVEDYYKVRFDHLLDKCVVPNASGRKCFSLAMLDDEDIRWMVDECPDINYLIDVTDDGGNNLYDIAHEKGFIRENGDVIGKWLETDIDVVYIDGTLYALDGWNGEKYLHCWKCIDRFTADPDGREYEIAPVYDWEHFNEDEVNLDQYLIGYEVH